MQWYMIYIIDIYATDKAMYFKLEIRKENSE